MGNLSCILTASTLEDKLFSPNNYLKNPWRRTLAHLGLYTLTLSTESCGLSEGSCNSLSHTLEGTVLFPDEGEEPGSHPSLENIISAKIMGSLLPS